MNILRIIYDFADKNVQSAGLSTGPYELTLSQGKLGDYKIFVLTGNLNGQNLKKGIFKYTLCDGKVTVYNLPRALPKVGPFLTSSLCVLPMYFYLKLTHGIDIVHNHQQMGVWFLLYKALFGWLDKTPIVHTNHGPIKAREAKMQKQGTRPDFWTKFFEYPLHKLSDYLSVKVTDAVISVSSNVQEDLEKYYKISKPLRIVENGVNIDKFSPTGDNAALGFSSDSIVIANGGRLSKRKNIDLLVESLRYLDQKYVLALWGKWDSELETHVNNLIKLHNLSSRVKYFGEISYWDVDRYFRAIHIFALPSVHEGLPKVVLEALASGNKVVASGFKLAHDMPNLQYLQDLTPNGIAQTILDISTRPNESSLAIKNIQNYYSWDQKVGEIDSIYHEVLRK